MTLAERLRGYLLLVVADAYDQSLGGVLRLDGLNTYIWGS